MNVADEIKKLRKQVTEIFRVITGLETTGGIDDLIDIATRNHNDLQNIGPDDHHDQLHKLDSTTDHDTADDGTNHDTSTARHGLCPKLPGDNTLYLDGDGNFTEPAGGGGGGTYVFYDPDYFPSSPSSQSDHFDDASIDGKWVEFDNGSQLTLSEAEHHLKMAKASLANSWDGVYQTLPAGDFTITAKFRYELDLNVAQYAYFGIVLYEDADDNPATCNLLTFCAYIYNLGFAIQILSFSQYNTYSSTIYAAGPQSDLIPGSLYLRVRRNGTTLYLDVSKDGMSWQNHVNFAEGGYFSAKQFGVGCWQATGAPQNFYVDWIYYLGSDSFLAPGRVRTA